MNDDMTEEEINDLISPLLNQLDFLQVERMDAYQKARRLVDKLPEKHRWRASAVACALEDMKGAIQDDMVGVIKP